MVAFARYVAVATALGLFTVGLRELLGWAFAPWPGQYAATMVLSYAVAMVLGYAVQGHFTFAGSGHRASRAGLGGFVTMALLMSILTAQLAYLWRYLLPLQDMWPDAAAALAFAAAALCVAPLSFLLARHLVFIARDTTRDSRDPLWVWLAMASGIALHAWALSRVRLRFDAQAIYDETLFVRLAQSLVDGAWLGPYTSTTLVKGPGLSLWLAVVHLLQMPLNLAVSLSYALACVLAMLATRPVLPGPLPRLALFVALLCCPMAFSDFAVMRELIYPALSLAVVACGVGLMLRTEQSWRQVQPWMWAAGLGASSAMLALTREETVWLLPLWLAVAARALWPLLGAARRGAVAWAPLMTVLLAGLFAALPMLGVASLNRQHYGVFTVLELNSRPFVSAYGALTRVRHAGAPPQVPVPRDVWIRAAKVSPAFAELNVHLQGAIGSNRLGPDVHWAGLLLDAEPAVGAWFADRFHRSPPLGNSGGGAWLQNTFRRDADFRSQVELYLGGTEITQAFFSGAMRQEIGGAWFVWVLREAAAASGHHRSAGTAAAFYQRLADDINAACERNELSCWPSRDTLRPVLQRRDLWPFLSTTVRAFGELLTTRMYSTGGLTRQLGEPAALAAAESFLHQPLAPSRTRLAPAQPFETLLAIYRRCLPWLCGLALLGWLAATPWPGRAGDRRERGLWWLATLLLLLVASRLALLSLIHVTSWLAAFEVRYLAPAQPLLVFFVVLGLTLLVARIAAMRSRQTLLSN